ncbi:response regulator transcription factor, partial [Pseudomonas proteolytica]|uniref:response regulator transcription factor n=1 Tax=Pseudomonas proteolytica TaxID=219574 RepID=UPI0030D7A94E
MTPKRTVQLVDDEDSIRKSAGFMLKTSGFAVQTYASGIAFLKAVKTAEPGCILLDVRMPGMDGLEVQEVLAERGITMPVIVLTGHGDVGIAVRVMKAGAVDFLEKPFEKSALLASIGVAFSRLDKSDARSLREAEARVRVAVLTPREREVLIGL